MKKILSVLLAVCLLAGCLPFGALAAEDSVYDDGILRVTNVTAQETAGDGTIGGGVAVACTAPAQVTILPAERGVTTMVCCEFDWDGVMGLDQIAANVYKFPVLNGAD